jgi:hypothetical protein
MFKFTGLNNHNLIIRARNLYLSISINRFIELSL